MDTAEKIIEELRLLPQDRQQEVLDFAHFLRERLENEQQKNFMAAQQASLANDWDNTEDEVWNDA
ncbi:MULTISPECIES: DUF2281 domain-containing protein [unclassified Halomonas]|uniref:DUF2281 domain-containing protein n=1 Tax=unclassified Halomonas TaxID=2609666 RepID=UPI0003B8EB5A|nr:MULTISPECIES: DUF2281 domain-containing protein [unclassified Halomonas]ERS82414.1 hypothetical protein Q671_11795 [Halomonas sp. PBN3]